MDSRRRLLQLLAGAGGAAAAGCVSSPFGDAETEADESTPTDSGGANSTAPSGSDQTDSGESNPTEADDATRTETPSLAERGVPGDICQQSQQPPGEQNIAAVIDPAFSADWTSHEIRDQYTPGREDGRLDPDSVVVGMTDGDRARAYPLAILWWHEIVNDTFGDPVVVTYCPLCRSGLVAARRVAGEPTQFTVTELLWTPPSVATNDSIDNGTTFGTGFDDPDTDVRTDRGNLVMIDAATGSYWSQLLARAICGPQTGTRLPIRASETASWRDWQTDHPDTDVLLPPPHSTLSNV